MSKLNYVIKKLGGKDGSVRYVNNALWLLSEKGLRVIEAFIVGLWIARYLGPEEFGILSYAHSFVFLFTAIATLGLDQIVVKDLVDYEEERDSILGTTFGLRLMSFFLMLFLIGISLWLSGNARSTNVLVFVIAVSVLFQSFNGIDFFFQSKVQSEYVARVNMVMIIISAIFKIACILTKAPLIYFAFAYIIETLICATGYVYFYKKKGFRLSLWKFDFSTAKKLLSRSWFLIIGAIATAVYMKIDLVMIKDLMGEREVGLYSAAVKTCSIWLFITMIITQSVFPSLVSLKKSNEPLYFKRMQQLYNLLIKISVGASIVYTIFSDEIIGLLFGEAYAESAGIMVAYVWSIVFVYLNNGSWAYYLNENLEKLSSIRLVIGAIINVTLNIFFIKAFGLMGAAYATLVSYAISGYLINVAFDKTRQNFVLQSKSILNFLNLGTWIHPFGQGKDV